MSNPPVLVVIDPLLTRRRLLAERLTDFSANIHLVISATRFEFSTYSSGVVIFFDDRLIRAEILARRDLAPSRWRLLAYTTAPRWRDAVTLLRQGVSHYFEWPDDLDTLVEEVRRLHLLRPARNSPPIADWRLSQLSERECAVLAGIGQGLNSRQLGEQLGLSPRTIEFHRARLLDKLGAANTAEAIRRAAEAGFFTSGAAIRATRTLTESPMLEAIPT